MALRLPPRCAKKESERKNSRAVLVSKQSSQLAAATRDAVGAFDHLVLGRVPQRLHRVEQLLRLEEQQRRAPSLRPPRARSQHSSSSSWGGCTTTTFASARASSPDVPCVDSPRSAMGTLRDVAKTLGFSLPPPPSTVPGFHEYAILTLSVDCESAASIERARSPSGVRHPPRTETRPPSPSSGTRHRRRARGTRSTRRSPGCQPSESPGRRSSSNTPKSNPRLPRRDSLLRPRRRGEHV